MSVFKGAVRVFVRFVSVFTGCVRVFSETLVEVVVVVSVLVVVAVVVVVVVVVAKHFAGYGAGQLLLLWGGVGIAINMKQRLL